MILGTVQTILIASRWNMALFLKAVPKEHPCPRGALVLGAALLDAGVERFLRAIGTALFARRGFRAVFRNAIPQERLRPGGTFLLIPVFHQAFREDLAGGVRTTSLTIRRLRTVHLDTSSQRLTSPPFAFFGFITGLDALSIDAFGAGGTTLLATRWFGAMLLHAVVKQLGRAGFAGLGAMPLGKALMVGQSRAVDTPRFTIRGRTTQSLHTMLVERSSLFGAIRLRSAVLRAGVQHVLGPHLADVLAACRGLASREALSQKLVTPGQALLARPAVLAAFAEHTARGGAAIASAIVRRRGQGIILTAVTSLDGGRQRGDHDPADDPT